jgi:hypothetical protein
MQGHFPSPYPCFIRVSSVAEFVSWSKGGFFRKIGLILAAVSNRIPEETFF